MVIRSGWPFWIDWNQRDRTRYPIPNRLKSSTEIPGWSKRYRTNRQARIPLWSSLENLLPSFDSPRSSLKPLLQTLTSLDQALISPVNRAEHQEGERRKEVKGEGKWGGRKKEKGMERKEKGTERKKEKGDGVEGNKEKEKASGEINPIIVFFFFFFFFFFFLTTSRCVKTTKLGSNSV